MLIQERVLHAFRIQFQTRPEFVLRAPGRVNLIGEHTDYNDGFVLPMAIDRAIWIAFRPRSDRHVSVHSLDFDQAADFDLDSLTPDEGWPEYIKGVTHELQVANYKLGGWEGVIAGDIPRGAGLSSSAALELAAARAFAAVSNFEWDAKRMARLAQEAENKWIGVNCGIMDQMVIAIAKEGHALYLDCRSLETQYIPLPKEISVVVLDTSTRRGLVDSVYNERRSQCEAAARFFGVKALRDVSVAMFEKQNKTLEDPTRRRARHVITENTRVLQAIDAMGSGNSSELGRLLRESHISLRDDFEVTNAALNQIVETAQEQNGCYGARMTGAGFGGCAVALVEKDKVQAFSWAVLETYRQKSGLEAKVYVCQASAGASLI
jgi:galactokinase